MGTSARNRNELGGDVSLGWNDVNQCFKTLILTVIKMRKQETCRDKACQMSSSFAFLIFGGYPQRKVA